MPAVVDSSGWIEYFTDGSNAERFAGAIADANALIVPSIARRVYPMPLLSLL
jgi:hypothetical protein